MLIFFKQNLALLANPKTGTTGYAATLRGKADIVFRGRRKHTSAASFENHVGPFLKNAYKFTPERVCVMREPLDHMRSWYKYRARPALAASNRSTANMSFDAFIQDAIDDPKLPHVNVGTQAKFLTTRKGELPLHHLFAYEHQELYRAFLEERFGRSLEIKRANTSPPIDTTISDETAERFRSARIDDYALYERVLDAGGHLQLEWG